MTMTLYTIACISSLYGPGFKLHLKLTYSSGLDSHYCQKKYTLLQVIHKLDQVQSVSVDTLTPLPLFVQGGWSLLQNTHLALDFLEELLLTVLETENVHEDFRLWLTSEVHPKYPINLLQACIKYTFEPPQGVKAGLKRTYTNTSKETLEYSNLPQWKPMYYTVAFLHTTVQERRKFGPLGWNIPYEYNQGDFNASSQYVMNLLDDLDLKRVRDSL